MEDGDKSSMKQGNKSSNGNVENKENSAMGLGI